jgi:hypothetical protein
MKIRRFSIISCACPERAKRVEWVNGKFVRFLSKFAIFHRGSHGFDGWRSERRIICEFFSEPRGNGVLRRPGFQLLFLLATHRSTAKTAAEARHDVAHSRNSPSMNEFTHERSRPFRETARLESATNIEYAAHGRAKPTAKGGRVA